MSETMQAQDPMLVRARRLDILTEEFKERGDELGGEQFQNALDSVETKMIETRDIEGANSEVDALIAEEAEKMGLSEKLGLTQAAEVDNVRELSSAKRFKTARQIGTRAVAVAAGLALAFGVAGGGSNEKSDSARAADADRSGQAAQGGANSYNLSDYKNIGQAVDAADINSDKERRNFLMKHMGTRFNLELNNNKRKMNAVDADYDKNELLAAAGLAMASDHAEGDEYGENNFNALRDRDINADTDKKPAAIEAEMKDFMTKKGTSYITTWEKFANSQFAKNHGMKDGGDSFGFSDKLGDDKVLVRTVKGMGTIVWKIEKEDGQACINILLKLPEQPTPPAIGGGEPIPPGITVSRPNPPATGGGQPETPGTGGGQPETPGTGGGEPSEEKFDDGELPGDPGVPADQDRGTPDVEGDTTPGVSPPHVPRQPQEPTPQPQQGESGGGRGPAVEGTPPANVDPNGSAQVPGTNNNQGQGGSVDPNGQ